MNELLSGLFTPDPGVVDGLLALSVIYALAVGPGRKYLAPDQPFEKKRAISFGIGFLILVAAVATPIDHIGETYLFSVHMLQHVMLMFFLPPFLTQSASKDGKVLGEEVDVSSVDSAVTRDHSVPQNLLLAHPEILTPVSDKSI